MPDNEASDAREESRRTAELDEACLESLRREADEFEQSHAMLHAPGLSDAQAVTDAVAKVFTGAARGLAVAPSTPCDEAVDVREGCELLEIGTGWGALAMRAAEKFGARVTTTTISAEQHAFATQRVREAGHRRARRRG